MGLKELDLKNCYDSDQDDILNDFYLPVLSKTIEYKRFAGFFSSNNFASLATGISRLIYNGGRMKLICGIKLKKEDIDAIIGQEDIEEVLSDILCQELLNIENKRIENHILALSWMLANKKLELKIAIKLDDYGNPIESDCGMFQQNFGILKDINDNIISFNTSNETGNEWTNSGEYKVFRNWIEQENEYLDFDHNKFENYWQGNKNKIKIINLPLYVESKLIEMAPDSLEKLNLNSEIEEDNKIELRDYQIEAINNWENNGFKGIFEMATGTGKTYTAIGCIDRVSDRYEKFITIISCPYQHLGIQWKKSIENFNLNFDELIIADSSNPKWKNLLSNTLDEIYLGYKNKLVIITTHRTLSSETFMNLIKENQNNNYFLIADEVHGLGAELSLNGLLDVYNLRLGLSATPRRWFDDFGTEVIYKYFSDTVYEFSLEKAISEEFLTQYNYYPFFISLTEDELDDYIEISKNIAINFSNKKKENNKLNTLIFKRSNIIKNASEKFIALEKILNKIEENVEWTIIYCVERQIQPIMDIINNRLLSAHLFTMSEGATPNKQFGGISEREDILKKFSDKKYDLLVAIKCLDEGVDVPPARNAILMASSGNPREYIQRIGRIIRKYPGKKEANIYDIVVVPSLNKLPKKMKELEMKIFKKEIERCEEIAKIASNDIEALNLLYELKIRVGYL